MKKVVFCGRLSSDIKLKEIGEKKVKLAEFSLAVDNFKKEAEFYDFKAWKGTAEVIQKYVNKGDKVLISGELTQEHYENKNGEKRMRYYIVVDEIELLGSRKKNEEKELNKFD